jgi:hypothetical protein
MFDRKVVSFGILIFSHIILIYYFDIYIILIYYNAIYIILIYYINYNYRINTLR